MLSFAPLCVLYDEPEDAISTIVAAIKYTANHSVQNRQGMQGEMIMHLLFGPLFTQMLSEGLTTVEMQTKLAVWQDIIMRNRNEWIDTERYLAIIQFLDKLAQIQAGHPLTDNDIEYASQHFMLNVLSCLARSTEPKKSLRDVAALQASAVDGLLQLHSCGYLMRGVATFLHRFWKDIVHTRAFALNSPRLFRSELEKTHHGTDDIKAVSVLESACQAVGVRLPAEVAQRFREARTPRNSA